MSRSSGTIESGRFHCACICAVLAFPSGAASGAEEVSPESGAETPVLEVVVTTATKKSEAEAARDVPLALTVLDGAELAARRVTDLEDLSYALPNVALDGIGTGKGIANFSIRGLGVAGSIPSIDPTVGIFVYGVYLGVNYGVVMDMLDLEAVEVLRGPQGLLFGRNVTGDAVLIYERGDSDGDGPATQNRHRFHGFDLAIDEPGFSRVEWRHAVAEANRRTASGDGLITNVFGWREVEHESLADIDSTIDPVFHLFAYAAQRQLSNELRYSGWLRPGWGVTLGAYAFGQDIRYREQRVIRAVSGAPFGGDQDHRTGGVFLNNDIELGGDWLLTIGARYTLERKDVLVATAGNSVCTVRSHRCEYDFRDGNDWRNVTPKIGLQFWPGADEPLTPLPVF